MKTTRVILKVPFYQHPAGTVFDLAENTEPSEWPDNELAREKLNFNNKKVYLLPDGGRGLAVQLPVSDTVHCPEHVFEGTDTRKGVCRATLVVTKHTDADKSENDTPPCGRLREENVSLQTNDALQSQRFLIALPPFEEVAEKMMLLDSLSGEMVMDYVLRNYKHTDTQLDWDVSDLNPGFYELRICFPGDWFHSIRFIKFFPFFVDPQKISPAPEKRWEKAAKQILEKFTQPVETNHLPNDALDFCLEWGEMFNKPTQERMMDRHRTLTQAEADELDKQAREVRSYVYGLCEQLMAGKISDADLHFETKRKYPWVNTANFNRMKNVGMYYAIR